MTYTATQLKELPVTPEKWRQMVDHATTLPEIPADYNFKNLGSYTLFKSGADYYANDEYHTVYGGPDDEGTVDGGDSTAVLNAVLDDGGVIFLKDATYNITDNLTPSKDCIVIGQGDGTILQMDASLSGNIFYATDEINLCLQNLCLDGNSVGSVNYGVEFQNGNFLAHNLLLKDITGSGIMAKANGGGNVISHFIVDSCRFNNIGNSGTHLGPAVIGNAAAGTIKQMVVSNNTILDCNEHGVKIYEASGCLYASVYNNYIRDYYSYGVWLGVPGKVYGNYIDTATNGKGIYLAGSGVAENNTVNATNDGIYATGSNNHIVNNVITNITGFGALAYTSGDNTVISGNRIDTCSSSGIYIYDSDYCVVANNNITNSTTRDIYLNNASYNLLSSNILTAAIAIGEYGTSDYNQALNNTWYGATRLFYTGPSLHSISEGNTFNYRPTASLIATPFNTAANSISTVQGDAAAPAASTDYKIYNGNIMISSTDSGDSNCAIQIDGLGGSALFASAQSTLTGMFVPRGYTLTWGAYTGSAPTVKIIYV
jgi:parallel beta-helix repeat protein